MNEIKVRIAQAFLKNKNLQGNFSENIIKVAEQEGLLGILKVVWSPKDQKVKKILDERHSVWIARDTIQRKVLLPIFEEFTTRNIRYILLKGWSLGDLLYPTLTRFSHDIDILIDPSHFHKAKDILLKSNFAPYVGRNGFRFTPLFKEEILSHVEYPVEVDLHRELFSRGRFWYSLNEILKRATSFDCDGIKIKKMCPEDEIWYLLLHIASHFYRPRMLHFVDVVLHYQHYGIDLNKLCQRFIQENNHYGAYFSFFLLTKMKLLNVNPEIIEKLAPDFLTEQLVKTFIENESRISSISDFVYRSFIVWNTTCGLKRKLSFAWHYFVRRSDVIYRKFKSR